MSKSTLSLILTRLSNPALFLRIEAEEMRAKDREFPLFFHCVRTRGTTQGSESSSLKPREREREKKKAKLELQKKQEAYRGGTKKILVTSTT